MIRKGKSYHEIFPKGRKGGGEGGQGTWVNFCWVCATGLSEPIPYHRPHIRQFWANVIFVIPTYSVSDYASTSFLHPYLQEFSFTQNPKNV